MVERSALRAWGLGFPKPAEANLLERASTPSLQVVLRSNQALELQPEAINLKSKNPHTLHL